MKPNIFFLVLDSFSANMYKEKNIITPNINSIIKNGVLFDHTITSSDYTIPFIQSVFSGNYPVGCGIEKEKYPKLLSDRNNYLSKLKENGYHLFATIGQLLHSLGFGEYFCNDDMVFEKSLNIHNGLGEKIQEKLKDLTSREPWFYYAHLMDLHRPCEVPSAMKQLKHSERYEYNLKTIDKWFGSFIKELELKNTLIIITADHGDYFSEEFNDGVSVNIQKNTIKSGIKKVIPTSLRSSIHEKKQNFFKNIQSMKLKNSHQKRGLYSRSMKQKYLFDDLVRVPLILSGNSINPHYTISKQIRYIDIMPTIIDIIGIPDDLKPDGKSVLPLLSEQEKDERITYLENEIGMRPPSTVEISIGIRTNDYKYFRNLKNSSKNVNLYDLRNDPLEINNIAKEDPDLIKRFEKNIDEIIELSSTKKNTVEKLDEESEKIVEAELKRLGYL